MDKSKKTERVAEPKTVSIVLSAEDQEYLERIKKEYGLIKTTDCLRLAVREAIKRIESQQTVAA